MLYVQTLCSSFLLQHLEADLNIISFYFYVVAVYVAASHLI